MREVPPETSICEFYCRQLDCTQGDWEVCEYRRGKFPLPPDQQS